MIYFLRAEQDCGIIRKGQIKIGSTKRMSQRLIEIAVVLGHTPTVLGVMDGGIAEEKALHKKLSDCRSTGEWFEPSMAIGRLIEAESRPWDGVDEVPHLVFQMRLNPTDEAILERIGRMVSPNMRGIPSRSRIIRWALLQLEAAIGSDAGPMIPPPD